MKPRIKVKLWLALVMIVFSLSAIAFATAGMLTGNATNSESNAGVNSPGSIKSHRSAYVRRSLLAPRLVQNLNALGNRLEKPGKERLTLQGTWQGDGSAGMREFFAILEFPDRLRLVMQHGSQVRVITFDGQQAGATRTPAAAEESDLIETLAYDTAERFFAAQMQGSAMRFLGTRFRTDDGSNPDYRGPYFDVYKIADQIEVSGQERPAKFYYFNSDTLMLERVTYVIKRDRSEINVETRLSDWREIEGQKVARRIERLENGISMFVLNIGSAQTGSRSDDGSFAQ